MKKDVLAGLTEEQIAKARKCKSSGELMALAAEEEVELTDEQLKAVAGGGVCSNDSNKKDEDHNHRKIES